MYQANTAQKAKSHAIAWPLREPKVPNWYSLGELNPSFQVENLAS